MTDLCTAALDYTRGDNPDLTVRQLALLGLICDRPGLSTGPLAELMDVSKPVVTRGRTTLANARLVETRFPPEDGRRVALHPTDRGLQLRRQLAGAA